MREYSTALQVDVPATGNLTDDVVRNARETPDLASFSRRGEDGWSEVTAADFHREVVAVAKGLIAAGIEPGDRVALVSRTRYEWTLLDYAIWFAAAVTVPVYATANVERMAWILGDAGVRAVVVETPEQLARVKEASDRLPDLRQTWSIEGNAVGALTALGGEVSDAAVEERRSLAGPVSLATLLYTSGTTGRPKGCRLTHGNFLFELSVTTAELATLFELEDAATLLFLPMPHIFARVVQVGAVRARVRLGHTADIRHLLDDLTDFRPTFILGVPRIFEKIFNTASQRAIADGRGRIFDRAAETAIAWSRGLDAGRPGVLTRGRHRAFDRLVYAGLREALGGRCAYAVSGGAPLGDRLAHFYRGIGVPVLEGYGLTETTAAVTVNLPDAQKIGTAGRPVQGTSVRVAEDGELLFRGGQVFEGYWNNDDATAAALDDDHWLHTGDVGEIDNEGFVRITGRKREILVTAGGKHVAPNVLEDRLRAHLLVDQCMVVGDGRPFIAALITLDRETLPQWAAQHGKSARLADLVEDPDLHAEVQEAVDAANGAVSKAEAIRRFRILTDPWTEEGGQLTPSLKLRRHVVLRECGEEIAALYSR